MVNKLKRGDRISETSYYKIVEPIGKTKTKLINL